MIGIAFSLSGTLVGDDHGQLEAQAFREVTNANAERLGLALDEEALLASSEKHCAPDRIGQPDFSGAVSQALHGLLRGRSSREALEAEFRNVAAALVAESVEQFPDVREALVQIASLGIPRAILTTEMSSVARRKAELADFDGPVIVAEDSGFSVADRPAFVMLATQLRLTPPQLWFVGANLARDVAAAHEAGLQTIWLDREATSHGFRTQYGHRVERLPEILPILAESYTRSLLGLRYVLHSTLEWRPGHFVPGAEYSQEPE